MPALSYPDPPLSDSVVVLRPLRPQDGDAVIAAFEAPEIPRWTTVPTPYGRPEWEQWLVTSAELARQGLGLNLVIAEAEDDERVLGAIGLNSVDLAAKTGDIGYWTAREARGRGIAARSTRLFADWAREHLALDPVLYIHLDNTASQRVAAAAGYRDVGERAPCPRGCSDAPDHIVFRR